MENEKAEVLSEEDEMIENEVALLEQEEEVKSVYRAMNSFKILVYGLIYILFVSTAALYLVKNYHRKNSDYLTNLAGMILLINAGFD